MDFVFWELEHYRHDPNVWGANEALTKNINLAFHFALQQKDDDKSLNKVMDLIARIFQSDEQAFSSFHMHASELSTEQIIQNSINLLKLLPFCIVSIVHDCIYSDGSLKIWK